MKTVAAAIDFGTSKIVTLLAESGGFTRCDIVGSGTVPYAGYMDGQWISREGTIAALRESIDAAEAESRRKIDTVYVGVPCENVRMLTVEAEVDVSSEDGRISDADIDAVQDAAADKLNLSQMGAYVIHRSPAWFSIDGGKKTMSPLGSKGEKIRANVSFILADPAFCDDVRGMLSQMGITVLAYFSSAIGLALLLLPIEERDRTALVIDVGYLNTEISVLEGDAITYHAVAPLGGGHITADLAQRLEISMAAAEAIKREFNFVPDEFDNDSDPEVRDEDGMIVTFPKELVRNTIEDTAGELMDMITAVMQDAAPHLGPKAQIFLTGGGIALMRGGREYVSGKLGRSVKSPMSRSSKLNSPRFASALGLVDLVFDSIEQKDQPEDSFANRLTDKVKNLFHK